MSMPYEAPLPLMRAAIELAARTAGFDPLTGTGTGETLGELAEAVLEGAGRFARDVLSPLNRTGDAAGSHPSAAGVATPAGFREAYRRFCADGWASVTGPRRFGGQELPMAVTAAITEVWAGANLSFAMCPEAAAGAVEVLRLHAAEPLRERYLPPLVSGAWTAAMALSEPQAGSDLSTVRTMAEPDRGGPVEGAAAPWRLRGRKVFISWGDHDLDENIIHLVLARTPGAPPGLKGISLFLVPKLLPGSSGDPRPNDLVAVSLEHKMGIRASPTCTMAYGDREGALGWLVGPLHAGVECLFSMMNQMRLGVGLHSTGLAERALQLALGYARERVQGRGATGSPQPIIEHADVRRMLLTMRALTGGARGLAYTAAATLDAARSVTDDGARARAERRLALLTPIVKACCSDIAVEVASLGVQVHGGTGYVDDSEISQVYRDARVGPIFEGTNYIQAHDLLARKVLRDAGAALGEWLAEIAQAADAIRDIASLAPLAAGLSAECTRLREAAAQLGRSSAGDRDLVGAAAYPFLQWLGIAAGAWQHALAAGESVRQRAEDRLSRARIADARFYAAHILPRAHAHAAAAASGADLLMKAEL
ncbi:MAG: acyl-CoA dehydrogenase [Steroidobacteraceae bacterium]